MQAPYLFCISSEPDFLHRIKDEYFKKSIQEYIIWANEGLSELFWNLLTIKPLFAMNRGIVVRHAENISKNDWENIEKYRGCINETLRIFFCCEGELPNYIISSTLYKTAEKNIWIKKEAPLTRVGLKTTIQQYCKKHGLQLEASSIDFLTQSLPLSTTAVSFTLSTLKEAAVNNTISFQEVKKLCAFTEEYTVWQIFNVIFSKKPLFTIVESIEKLSFFHFSSLLQKELLTYGALLNNENVQLSSYALQKKYEMLHHFSFRIIEESFDLLLTVEMNIKQGIIEEKEALYYAIEELHSIANN